MVRHSSTGNGINLTETFYGGREEWDECPGSADRLPTTESLTADGGCGPGAYGAGVAGRRGTAGVRTHQAKVARRQVATAPRALGRASKGAPILFAGERAGVR